MASYNFLCVLGAAIKRHTDLPDICSVLASLLPEDHYPILSDRFAQNHIRMLDKSAGDKINL